MVDWRILSMSYFVERANTDSHCSAVNRGITIGSLGSPSVSQFCQRVEADVLAIEKVEEPTKIDRIIPG